MATTILKSTQFIKHDLSQTRVVKVSLTILGMDEEERNE